MTLFNKFGEKLNVVPGSGFNFMAVETRKKLLSEIKNTDTLLIGSHFANPVAGKIKQLGDTLVFEV